MIMFPGSELSLAFLFDCTAKATILLGLAWIVVGATRRRAAALRHLVLSTAILGSLILPLLTLLLPTWHWTMLGKASGLLSSAHEIATNSREPTAPSMIVTARTAAPFFSRLSSLALIVWAAGFLFIVMRLAAGLARLAWMSRHAKPLLEDDWIRAVLPISRRFKITRSVRVLECRQATMPLTWGVVRPFILLPAGARDWTEDRMRIVLCHEFAHVARGDWLLQMFAELTRGLYWFHPLAWIAAALLRQESEHACDDSVLNYGIPSFDYAHQLLDLARTFESPSRACAPALALARPSNLERRFTAMLNQSIDRRQLSPRMRLLIFFFALCLLLPLAALRLPAQELSGRVSGTVYDPSGAPVPNATVIMKNRKSKAAKMTTSDGGGNFSFAALAAGEYDMMVMKPGFADYKVSQVVLEPTRELTQKINLKVGSINEEVDVVAEGTAKTPPAETPSRPERVRLGGDVQAAKLLEKVLPVYPTAAKSANIQGTVILHAIIGMEGNPLSLRVVNTQIDPELARAAVEAVSKWRYSPTLLNGDPLEVDTTITVNFTLSR
jgi:TonB family protein